MIKNEILDFIKRRWNKDANWLDGNCYWFAYILKARFPILEIYYLPASGHFICGYNNEYYDWTGMLKIQETPILLSDIQHYDSSWYNRIIKDCMM